MRALAQGLSEGINEAQKSSVDMEISDSDEIGKPTYLLCGWGPEWVGPRVGGLRGGRGPEWVGCVVGVALAWCLRAVYSTSTVYFCERFQPVPSDLSRDLSN